MVAPARDWGVRLVRKAQPPRDNHIALAGAVPFALWIGGAWPPSADHRNRVSRGGIHYPTQDYKDFTSLVADAWRKMHGPPFGAAWLECELHFVRPDRRRRDAHNTIKSLLDALEHAGAFEDDINVNPRVASVRDLNEPAAHPLIPQDQPALGGPGIFPQEPGVLVILKAAAAGTYPGS